MISAILTIGWYIYVIIMMPTMLFSGGLEEFLLGLLATCILLIIPLIFHKPFG